MDGAESTYEAKMQEFSLRAEGALEKFVSVEVDGKASTNIKVTEKTPATEDVKDESTEVVTEDAVEDTENKDTTKPDKDGVPGSVWVILVIALLAAGATGVILYRKKIGNEGEKNRIIERFMSGFQKFYSLPKYVHVQKTPL